jgi:guanylate kinase
MSSSSLPQVICVVGCSGAGKDTIVNRVIAAKPGVFARAISHTTRAIRQGEPGDSYHFVDNTEFDKIRKEGRFIECVEMYGNRYGLTKKAITDILDAGKHCFCIVNVDGLQHIKEFRPCYTALVVASKMRRRGRLFERGDSPQMIGLRMKNSTAEVLEHDEQAWSMILNNEYDANDCVKAVVDFVR